MAIIGVLTSNLFKKLLGMTIYEALKQFIFSNISI